MTPVELEWTERWWFALGSHAHCQVLGGPDGLADRVIEGVERLEQCWSRFRDSSELSRLNADPSACVEVSRPLAEALARSLLAWELTEGWFDPTVIDSMESAGYGSSFVPDDRRRGDLRECRPSRGPADVTVDVGEGVVRRPPGLRFDLGGIGKGLAADSMAVWLIEQGAISACISLGGDVRTAGVHPDHRWRIPVEHPVATGAGDQPDVWFEAELTEGALVASTTEFRRWTSIDGHSAHHLIDPRTGCPSTSGVTTVVVAAAEAWWAEVLAKAALLAGRSEGQRLLDRHRATGWLVGEGLKMPIGLAC